MNLKDRLENIIKTNNIITEHRDMFAPLDDSENEFVNDDSMKELFYSLLSSNTNIIYVCDKSINPDVICNYFYSISKHMGASVIDDIEYNISNLNNKINIVSNPSVSNAVKIFEYILYGYKTFIFGLNFSSNENFIDKLRTVILLNYPNMTEKNIDVLIGYSDSVVASISENKDGLLFVSEVNKICYKNGVPVLVQIQAEKLKSDSSIETVDNVVIDESPILTENGEENSDKFDSDEQNLEIQSEIITETDTQLDESIQKDSDTVNSKDITEAKINKYKLLKEKAKNKRNL